MPTAYQDWTVLPHGPIEKLSSNLWRIEGSIAGIPMPRTMTVVRIGKDLLVHSPCALDEPTMAEINGWGMVRWIVVPSGYHRLDSFVYKQRYPEAEIICPRGARPRVEAAVQVSRTYDEFDSSDSLQLLHLRGLAEREGVVKIQSEEGTSLIFNDAVFNMAHIPGPRGWALRWIGSSGGPRVTLIARTVLVKDKKLYKEHLQALADTPDLVRIVVGHGSVIAQQPGETLRTLADTYL